MSWVDIDTEGNEIVCRYCDTDRPVACYWAEQIEVYGRDDAVHRHKLLASVNGERLPGEAKLAFEDEYTVLHIFLPIVPKYPRAIRQYGKAIANVLREHGMIPKDCSVSRVSME